MALELVPGPFLFLKNPLQKGIRGSLMLVLTCFDSFVITYLQSMGLGQIGIKLGKNLSYTKSKHILLRKWIYLCELA